MEANRTRRRWTYEEYARLPLPSEARGMRYEVIDGELVVTPGPSVRHQRIVGGLFAMMHAFIRSNGLGEVFISPFDVIFAEGDYLEPDILYVRADRAHVVKDRGVEGPPDLVVEVLSPSTATRDRGIKLERYRHYAVSEYWVVDPDQRTIEVWDLAAGVSEPAVHRHADTLRWTPVDGGATLEIELAELLGE